MASSNRSKGADPSGPDQLLTHLPALDETHRKAFSGQFPDADCLALGARTKSEAVRNVALAWAAEAAPLLTGPQADDVDYDPSRLAWVVELVVKLDVQRDDAGLTGKKQSSLRSERDLALSKAKVLHARLASKLKRAAPGGALDGAAAGESVAELAAGLKSLANLVDQTVQSKDPSARILAQTAKLTAADAQAARDAAKSLSTAGEQVTLGGRAKGDRDTPAVNLVEGRLLKELLFLRDAFDEAKGRGVPVPALAVTPGVKQVLAHNPHGQRKPPNPPATTPQK